MAQNSYTRFSVNEREILFKRLAEGKGQKDIAIELNRNPSTISREIRRTGMNRLTYRPSLGEKHSCNESQKRKRKYKLIENQDLAKIIEEKLMLKWSPEQISGKLKASFPDKFCLNVSHETIYRYIYSIENKESKEFLISCLRQSRKRRRPKKPQGKKRTTIRKLTSIHERPKEVEKREIPGHWEGDLVIGKDNKSAIGTLVERTTRFTIIVLFQDNHTTREVCLGFAAALGLLPPHMKKSLTYDRGSEMAGHKWFTEITGIPVFFADPYSPWQRGTNENTNGLVRNYLPKKTDFKDINDDEILKIQNALNLRPRKNLDYFDPKHIFEWFCKHKEATINDFYTLEYPLAL